MPDVFLALVLSALMGMLGQGARAVMGLKKAGQLDAANPSQQAQFNGAYLLISLVIGAIAGILAGMGIGLDAVVRVTTGDFKVLLGIAAAGYAGADFIESAFSNLVPNTTVQSARPTPHTTESLTSTMSTDAQTAALSNAVNTLTNAVTQLSGATPAPSAPTLSDNSGLAAALRKVAPMVNTTIWAPALQAGFQKFNLSSNRRAAAAVGQFLVEAGAGFQELAENLNYTHAERLVAVFPSHFASVEEAAAFVGKPEAIGNHVYANRLGNGDEASGDGFRFRGRGLIQLTGRAEYAEFAKAVGMSVEDAARYCETTEGAAVSGCWYLATRGCLPHADNWEISTITRLVNGNAMLGASDRLAYANAMLQALGG